MNVLGEITGESEIGYISGISPFASRKEPATAGYVAMTIQKLESAFKFFQLTYHPPSILPDGVYEKNFSGPVVGSYAPDYRTRR